MEIVTLYSFNMFYLSCSYGWILIVNAMLLWCVTPFQKNREEFISLNLCSCKDILGSSLNLSQTLVSNPVSGLE